jgi:hypothetical protein
MANRLWEFKNSAITGPQKLVHYFSAGIFQALACQATGELGLHIIEENAVNARDLLSDAEAVEIKMDTHFALVPKPFRDTAIPGFNGNSIIQKLDDTTYIRFEGNSGDAHIAIPLYFEAKKRAALKANYLLAFLHGDHCFVLFFRNGALELSNAYPVSNEAEVLYYCMAAVKKAAVDVRNMHFDILGNQTKDLLQVFGRFGGNAKNLQLELPYPTGEYPPFAAESFLLYQYLLCELPVDL